MKTDLRQEPSGPLSGKQQAVAAQALVYIIFGFIGANIAIALVVFQIAGSIQHRRQPLPPPSDFLLALFYGLGLLCLLGSALWMRFRIGSPLSLPAAEFSQQTMIALALANVCEYLGVFWVLFGGAFSLSVPLLAGPALVTLGFLLPTARKRVAQLKQRGV